MKTVLCYGDSNTHGTIPIDFELLDKPLIAVKYRLPKEKRWSSILQKDLGDGYEVIEEGLNGRTTVWNDPTDGSSRNGLTYLMPCLETHAPIDLVILMLGTNDLKPKFSASAYDIAMGLSVLIDTIQKSGCGPDGQAPKILVLCPPPLGAQTNLVGIFGDNIEKSKNLAANYEKVAKLFSCSFMDAGKIIKPSSIDGVHYDEEDVAKIGHALAAPVKNIIG